MAELSESELILLDNLIYLDYFAAKNSVDENSANSLYDIVKDLKSNDESKNLDLSLKVSEADKPPSYPAEMSRSDWLRILDNTAEKCRDPNSGLSDLKLVASVGGDEEKGIRAAVFLDGEGNATVVFRGTAHEWHDNGEGAYKTDTDAQKEALEWYDSTMNELKSKYEITSVTVTGHSKGGNKAQYITVVSKENPVDRCVSFDGQGFGEDFLQKYEKEIAENRNKILSISAQDDFVHCILTPIAGTRRFIKTEFQTNFAHNHCPNIVLDENGNLNAETVEGEVPIEISHLLNHYLCLLPEWERSMVVDGLIGLMENADYEEKESVLQTVESISELIKITPEALLMDSIKHVVGETIACMKEELEASEYIAIGAAAFHLLEVTKTELKELVLENIKIRIEDYIEKQKLKLNRTVEDIVRDLTDFVRSVREMWIDICCAAKRSFYELFGGVTADFVKVDFELLEEQIGKLDRVVAGIRRVDQKLDAVRGCLDWYEVLEWFQIGAIDLTEVNGSWNGATRSQVFLREIAEELKETERRLHQKLPRINTERNKR